jgi:hypothetical protein
MSAIKRLSLSAPGRARERGVAAVEFALVAMIFFLLFFGIIELARAMYVCNTLQEVTRRGAALAAKTDFSNPSAMQQVRQRAIFRDSAGPLLFAEPVTDAHIRIEYMRLQRTGKDLKMVQIPSGSLPGNPAENHLNCLKDPYGDKCIRLVRVSVCQPGDGAECTPVRYQSLVALIPFTFDLPRSVTIVNAETLGMPGGLPPEPCGCT